MNQTQPHPWPPDCPAPLRSLIELQLAHLSSKDQTLLEAGSVAEVEGSAATVAEALERAENAQRFSGGIVVAWADR
jgi:hypothetical protein